MVGYLFNIHQVYWTYNKNNGERMSTPQASASLITNTGQA
ncbi:MAG: hypothetical protein ACJASL_002773, partial [Paraglaciecola sp.]